MKRTLLSGLFIGLLSLGTASAQSQGPNNPGTAQSANTGCLACPGSIWGNPTYITTSNNQFASTTMTGVSNCFQSTCWYSRELLATNFGFTIPTSNTTVTGIRAEIQRNAFSANVIKDSIVTLVLSGSAIGNNLALAQRWGITSNYYVYGSSTNKWGTSVTPADVNDPTFGVSLKTANTATNNQSAYVDHVRMTVYYTTTTGITYSITSENGVNAFFNDKRNLTLNYRLVKDSPEASITIYNLLGQPLFTKGLDNRSAGSFQEEFETSTLGPGVYIVRLHTSQGDHTRKVTLQ